LSTADLVSCKADAYIEQQNVTLIAFLSGLVERQVWSPNKAKHLGLEEQHCASCNLASNSHKYMLCKTVESIANFVRSQVLLPFHLRKSILVYSVTGSRLTLKTVSQGSPYASYDSLRKFLNTIIPEVSSTSDSDCIATFDNNQILQRRWKVKLSNQVHCSVVTMVVFFKFESKFQFQENLRPCDWMERELSDHEEDKVTNIDEHRETKEIHSTHLYPYLQERLENVILQQTRESCSLQVKCTDDIDNIIAMKKRQEHFKTCYSCGSVDVPKTCRVCPFCKANVTKAKFKAMGLTENGNFETDKEAVELSTPQTKEYRVHVGPKSGDENMCSISFESQNDKSSRRYSNVDSLNHTVIPEIHVQDPVFVNPCSYAACATVLRNIGTKAGITRYGGKRHWIVVCCEGLPYGLCRRLIA
jgi:translation initiation factor 2 beta subunit (eIF-2beta)/eIF-5